MPAMIAFTLSYLWHGLVGWVGITGVVLAGAIAVFVWVPINAVRHGCVAVATVCVVILVLYLVNLLPIDGLESDDPPESPNMLPPPHPDRAAPTPARASATRRWRAQPAPIACIRLLRIIPISPTAPTPAGRLLEGTRAAVGL